MSKKTFVFPPELEPYRGLINNTGGNTIEELMDRWYNEKNLGFSNVIVATLCACVESQLTLLMRLHKEGKLK